MMRKRNTILVAVAVLAVAGLGAGVAVAAAGSPGQPAASPATSGAVASPAAHTSPVYSWYRSMMNGYYGNGGGMMGGSAGGWMMSPAGYQWMTGGTGAPGWMRGGTLPTAMMGGAAGTDPGTVMGALFANAPGPRVSPADAQRGGSQAPAAASVNRAARTITFTTSNVNLIVLASPSMAAESFRIAGMTDPAIIVPAGHTSPSS